MYSKEYYLIIYVQPDMVYDIGLQRLENQSLWQRLNSLINFCIHRERGGLYI